jgi:hypothetical protein
MISPRPPRSRWSIASDTPSTGSTRPPRAVVAALGGQLRADGLCRLPGFLTPEATAPRAYRGMVEQTPYYRKDGVDYPPGHPRVTWQSRDLCQVAADLVPRESGLWRLYASPAMAPFLAALTGAGTLYRDADPHQALNISIMEEGGHQQWHFDSAGVIITLMLQALERGGAFECVPGLRAAEDENYAGVKRVIDGARDRVVTVPFEPGTLMLFRGMNSLHRVIRTEGARRRLIAILSYHETPDRLASPEANAALYGARIINGPILS